MEIKKPFSKFLIGLTAGLCVTFLPRLTAVLAISEKSGSLKFLTLEYIGLSLFFALMIGMIVMILEWEIPAKPRDTFMTALGIPALITGTINTATVAISLEEIDRQNEELTKTLSRETDIPIRPSGESNPKRTSNL